MSSSSWPAFLPNPNTGEGLPLDNIWPRDGQANVTARNTVHLGGSALRLPTVPLSALPPMPVKSWMRAVPGLLPPAPVFV